MEDRVPELTPRTGRKLPRGFFTRDTFTVARELLGTRLVRTTRRGRLVGRIVEVEAYPGRGDPASHSYRGETPRNSVMFGPGGHLYVYFTYGMHFCSNVVTGKRGEGCAVLLRAVEPLEGADRMVRNRGLGGRTPARVASRLLTGGPARLCQALDLTMDDNGTDLTASEIYILPGAAVAEADVVRTTRIGVSAAKGKRWRFFIRGNPFVSRA